MVNGNGNRGNTCLYVCSTVMTLRQLAGGVVTLNMEEIKAAYPNIKMLVGSSVYVKASVLTKTGKTPVHIQALWPMRVFLMLR